MYDLWHTLLQIVSLLGTLIVDLLWLALRWSAVIIWVAWWLWAVDWRKLWPVLARGAWAPVVLISLVVALMWSAIAPSDLSLGAFGTLPNFCWQLAAVTLLLAVAGFCGWLQGVFGWFPPEINLEPAPAAHDDHGHHH